MMHKIAAVLLMKPTEDVPESQDSSIKYVTEQLHMLSYNVEKTKVIADEAVLNKEIEASIKQCDIVVIIGGIASPNSNLICQAVSNVLHQKTTRNSHLHELLNKSDSEETHIPMYAKILEYSTVNASNNVHGLCPVLYIQGVLLIPSKIDLLKLSFAYIAVPFLKNFGKRPVLRKALILRDVQNNLAQKLSELGDNVDVIHSKFENGVRVTLSTTSMSALLDCVQSIKEIYKDGVTFVDDDAIPRGVYKQVCYPHIRNSIECIEECFAKYGPENVFLSFNGGKDCTVLLHLTLGVLKKHYPKHSHKLLCLYVECPNAFSELNSFVSQCRQYYDLNMINLKTNIKESLAHILESKPNMRACLMGTRRTDPHCEHLQPFQMTDPNWPQVMRVSPLLEWHYSEIWDYLLHSGVPYCSLYDMGYTSLGSVHNTTKNPSLKVDDDLKSEVYLPAYKLLDAAKERNGRIQTISQSK